MEIIFWEPCSWALLLLGCALLFWERRLIKKGFDSYRWIKTKAHIKDQRDESFAITGFSYRRMGSASIHYQEMAYIYEYRVADRCYESSNYCFGGHMDRAQATYQIGQHVPVYYNPNNPQEAVLRRGLTPGALIGLLPVTLGITTLIGGILAG